MKRSPLKRKTPLKRTQMKQRRPKPRDAKHGGDPDRVAWVRQQPCCACNAPPPNHAHHLIGDRKGLALKAPDSETLALCMQCHKDLHEKLGMFRVISRDDLLSWQRAKITRLQLLYSRHLSRQLADAVGAGKLARGVRDELDGDERDAIELVAKRTSS